MRTPKKYTCRWHDYNMDCCRHPMAVKPINTDSMRIFAEWACVCKKGCGYEKCDSKHPAWDAKKEPNQ